MENSLDHLFGNLMGGLDEIVKDAENIVAKHHPIFLKKSINAKFAVKKIQLLIQYTL